MPYAQKYKFYDEPDYSKSWLGPIYKSESKADSFFKVHNLAQFALIVF